MFNVFSWVGFSVLTSNSQGHVVYGGFLLFHSLKKGHVVYLKVNGLKHTYLCI